MGNVNKIILVGHLGQDPELKRTPNERAYCHLSVATHHGYKDQNGVKQDRTDWHRVTVWGDTAEHCVRYLAKGRQVFIEGRLQTRTWNDKEGKRQSATGVVAIRVVFLGGSGGAAAQVREAA